MLSVFIFSNTRGQVVHHLDCGQKQTQREINTCAMQNFVAADGLLDSLYKSMVAEFSYARPEGSSDTTAPTPYLREALVQSQHSWYKYREDAGALISTSFDGGSAANAQACEYMTLMTLDRIRALKNLRNYLYGKQALSVDWDISRH